MGQGMKDGIYVDNAFFVVEENKSEFPLYMRLINGLPFFKWLVLCFCFY